VNAVLDAGEEFGIRVAAPSMAKRVEAGMMNYGSDMTIENNPFQITGLERLVRSSRRTTSARPRSRRSGARA
jgi:dimethylsulfoniopropionate demethylase